MATDDKQEPEWNPEPGKVLVVRPNAGALQRMLDMQRDFQLSIVPENGGGNPVELRSPDYIRLHVDAAKAELQELLDETGWKPWSKWKGVNLYAARGEWIDAWHFLMNLALTLEMDEGIIVEMYEEKLSRNKARQQNDYDMREGKCAGCKRDFSDLEAHGESAITRYAVMSEGMQKIYHSQECYEEHAHA